MSTLTLPDPQWSKIVKYLNTCPDIYIGKETDLKRFVQAVLWITRSGSQWRLLPKQYGKWNSVYKRFARWCDKGIFHRLHQHFASKPDMEWLIIDTTIIRAHPCAAGALKISGGQACQALGRGRGGFSTKIHVAVDGLGNPLRFSLTAGQRHDITCAEALIDGYSSDYVIADTSYDSMPFVESITRMGAVSVIPPRANRRKPRTYDVPLYKERHLVECFINKIKHYRRIFSRFDKLANRYLGFLSLVAAIIWLRSNVNRT
jgi:transposase